MGGTIANLFVILLILSGVIYLFLHQLKQVELDELEQIQYVNHQAENGLASLLDKMPVGVIKVNGEPMKLSGSILIRSRFSLLRMGNSMWNTCNKWLAIPFEGKAIMQPLEIRNILFI